MDRSSIVYLIASTTEQDENGVWRKSHTRRQVFCNVSSITQREFFEAGRNGFNPEYRFTMFKYDYQDERLVEYNGKSYAVYRTYEGRNDEIELYCERKGGANGKEAEQADQSDRPGEGNEGDPG